MGREEEDFFSLCIRCVEKARRGELSNLSALCLCAKTLQAVTGMDGKSMSGSAQQAQQNKPDAVTDNVPSDQGAMEQFALAPVSGHESVDMNMEAAISAEDVIRAGGFGAKDDIGSLLPTAMDPTDFEASLRDARDFEGETEQPSHPGLGYRTAETDDDGSKLPLDVSKQ